MSCSTEVESTGGYKLPPPSLSLSFASFPSPCLTPGSRHLQQEAKRQAATNGLALAALVPGPPELWRQRGSRGWEVSLHLYTWPSVSLGSSLFSLNHTQAELLHGRLLRLSSLPESEFHKCLCEGGWVVQKGLDFAMAFEPGSALSM